MAKLAINGGEPVVKRSLGKGWPIFDEREEKAVLEVLHSGEWNRRSKVEQVGEAFAAYQQAKYGIPVANGTLALQCALKAAGVEAGSEVIVPALTFVATATSVVLVNAIPIMVDIDPMNYNISPEAVKAAVTDKTSAIIPVHNGGYPADMDRIMEISEKHGIPVIEDCAHAHGSEWRGRRLGSIGHLGAFSFQIGKTLTCGEGGIVLTNDEELAKKASGIANINMRMTDLQAALLLCQMERLDEQVETRERNTTYLVEGMEEIDGVEPIKRDERVTRWCFYYWNFRYISDEFDGVPRGKFLEALGAEGVPCGVGAHGQPIYRDSPFSSMDFFGKTGCPIKCPLYGKEIDYSKVYCPEAERVYRDEACSFTHRIFLGEKEDMDLILDALRKLRENTNELK
ncbi:DegT/DnrJ/EryC1/StrS family aminotransferase [bacterium]|nr:DegT/DnrJ/EryC1/StrS family aminotransferase [bacterium]